MALDSMGIQSIMVEKTLQQAGKAWLQEAGWSHYTCPQGNEQESGGARHSDTQAITNALGRICY